MTVVPRAQPEGFHPFHKPKGVSYMVEDSLRGIALAASLGKKWIDLDVNATADLVPILGHWDDPRKDHFIVPKWMIKKYNGKVRISNCTWSDLQKLRTKPLHFMGRSHVYKYRSTLEALILCNEKSIGAAFEIKGRPLMEDPRVYEQLLKDQERAYVPDNEVMWMTLQNIGNPLARLKAMTEAGGQGKRMLLARGNKGIPVSWQPYIDYVRGPIKWDGTR
jgi:glycerophosphoryl diester phosphodiesterase